MRSLALSALVLTGALCTFACTEDPAPPAGDGLVRQIQSEADLVPGVEAAGRIGDYVLDNGKVRFIVHTPESTTGWSLYGGSLVDASAIGAEGPSPDLLEEIFVHCDLRGFAPRTAEIVAPGGDGQPGVLRLVGVDAGIPFLDAIFVRDPLEVTITVDLVLAPEARSLDIEIAAKDERKRGARELSCGLIVLPGDAHRLFAPGRGFTDSPGSKPAFIAAEAEGDAASYVISRPDGAPVEVMLSALGLPFLPVAKEPEPFLANATLRDAYRLTLSEPGRGVAGAVRAAGLVVAEGGRQVRLQLSGFDLGVLEAPSVRFARAGEVEALTAGRPNADGVVQVELPPGGYDVTLNDRIVQGALAGMSLDVPAGAEPLELELQVGALGVVALDSVEVGLDGAEVGPTPARVRAIAGPGANPAAGAVFEAYVPASARFALPAGAYTLVVSRGPEHERAVLDVEVSAGRSSEVQARLERVVDRAGWVSADLHVHGTRSTDSEVSKRARVLGAVAEGVDVLVATDHDAVTDYAPTARELGLQDALRTAPGTEISPLYGHINGFPLRATAPEDHWRPGWFVYGEDGRFDRVLEPDEIVRGLREAGAKVVQLNHPRGSQHLFGYIGLDPSTGQSERTWPEADAMELMNGKRFDDYAAVLADFFGLVAAGRRLTLTGTSDVHGDFGVGYARTYVRVPSRGALAELDLEEVWAGLRAGHAVCASGPFVELIARRGGATAQVGETLSGAGPVSLEVRVQAPSWIQPEQVRVFEAGEVLFERPITAEDADPDRPALRLDHTFTATVTQASYFMVEVRGSGGQPHLRDVLTMTNPVFVSP